jgi:two-component SAPR family response regulator
MNCIIVDDEEMARAIIAQFVINRYSMYWRIFNAIQAMKFLNQNQVDLIF